MGAGNSIPRKLLVTGQQLYTMQEALSKKFNMENKNDTGTDPLKVGTYIYENS